MLCPSICRTLVCVCISLQIRHPFSLVDGRTDGINKRRTRTPKKNEREKGQDFQREKEKRALSRLLLSLLDNVWYNVIRPPDHWSYKLMRSLSHLTISLRLDIIHPPTVCAMKQETKSSDYQMRSLPNDGLPYCHWNWVGGLITI